MEQQTIDSQPMAEFQPTTETPTPQPQIIAPIPNVKKSPILPILLVAIVLLVGGYFAVTFIKTNARNKAPEAVDNNNAHITQTAPTPTASPTPFPIDSKEAVEIVRKLPEVQEYLTNNPTGIVEYAGMSYINAQNSESGKAPLVHVYSKLSDAISTHDWYRVNDTGVAVSATSDTSATDLNNFDKFTNSYTLPAGWTAELELSEFIQGTHYEKLIVKKGDYKLIIGGQTTGRANCLFNKKLDDFVQLTNPNLSKGILIRGIKPEEYEGYSSYMVCANVVNQDEFDYITLIGEINYEMPLQWDKAVVKEMDLIVESLRK